MKSVEVAISAELPSSSCLPTNKKEGEISIQQLSGERDEIIPRASRGDMRKSRIYIGREIS